MKIKDVKIGMKIIGKYGRLTIQEYARRVKRAFDVRRIYDNGE